MPIWQPNISASRVNGLRDMIRRAKLSLISGLSSNQLAKEVRMSRGSASRLALWRTTGKTKKHRLNGIPLAELPHFLECSLEAICKREEVNAGFSKRNSSSDFVARKFNVLSPK